MALFFSNAVNNVLWFLLGAFGFPHRQDQCRSLVSLWFGSVEDVFCPMSLLCLCQRYQQSSDLPGGTMELSLGANTDTILKVFILVFRGTVENSLPAHSRVMEVSLVNQWYCHHDVFLSSAICALSLPLSRFISFKIFAATNSVLLMIAVSDFLK